MVSATQLRIQNLRVYSSGATGVRLNTALPPSVRLEPSREAVKARAADGCLVFARHERILEVMCHVDDTLFARMDCSAIRMNIA